ncbi:MAG: HlyD family efflux transporter periplasmic adaptor subunit, partial [Deinococcales bacterium]
MRRSVHVRPWMILVAVVALAAAGVAWWLTQRHSAPEQLELYGNVDFRQVSLAFDDMERIATVDVQEGDRVHKGETLARLDTARLEAQVAQAEAQVAAQQAAVERLRHGSLPEEIAQARANLTAAKADAGNAQLFYQRTRGLVQASGASQQDLDSAKAALDVANAKVVVAQNALDLAVKGPRPEDVAQAAAQLKASEAQLTLLRQQLADATLVAPVDGVVRSRLMEPGEIASPQRPVVILAVDDPKWVRAYVSETELPRIRPGMTAYVLADGVPDHRFDGWIGFISSVAEFTPKTIQTQELRTSLVYEVRVFVNDPSDALRLGMPVTVVLPNGPATATPPAATPPA